MCPKEKSMFFGVPIFKHIRVYSKKWLPVNMANRSCIGLTCFSDYFYVFACYILLQCNTSIIGSLFVHFFVCVYFNQSVLTF